MSTALSFIKSFASLSTDVVILIAVTILFIAIGIFYGKKHLISGMLAFYPTHLIVKSIPSFLAMMKISVKLNNATLCVLFVAFYLFSAFVLYRHLSSEYSYNKLIKFIEIILISIAITAETLVFYLGNPFFTKMYHFSGVITSGFTGGMIFIWLIMPFCILYFFKH